VPVGGRYDPRTWLARPLRALRGGPDGIAVGLEWRAGAVVVTVLARGACTPEDTERAFEAARGLTAVDDDPSELLRMIARHRTLSALARGEDPRLGRTPTLFEAFAAAVIEQLVTSFEARESVRRLWTIAGERIADTTLRAAPTSLGVRDVPMWKLRAIGVGARRAVTLRDGARRGASLERLRALPPDEVIRRLESLRGVGPWTANRVARTALGYADAVPVGDLHAPSYVTEALTGEPGDDDAMLAALEPFRPHRARVVKLIERQVGTRASPSGAPRRLPRVDPHRREPWKY
jgi:3-methyladenine DNA glycosylase/8-oxoguanine DNA glycosylase